MYRDLHKAGYVSKVALEDVRVKVREARVTCGYDFATPEGNDEGVDRLEEDAWYDIAYPVGEERRWG